MSENQDLKGIFTQRDTTLADIKAAGWEVYCSSSGQWWWVQPATEYGPRLRQSLPYWVRELIENARRDGANSVRSQIAHALKMEKPRKEPTK